MTIHETRLANGMRVVSTRMPHLETVSMGIWVGVGARHETAPEQGISHLLEHMAFKGTERRSAREIAEEIEAVGGELNAATSLEMTAYFARVLAADTGLALDILSDILQSPRYSEEELEREREVILQEIAATRDSPDEIAYELLQEVAFPDQAIGRPILGTAASVKSFNTGDLRRFLTENYSANRIVLSAAGKVDHDQLVRHAEALFGGLNGGQGGKFEPANYGGGTRASAKAFEQSHLLIAFEGPSYAQDGYYTAQVFSALFGGGMSSRLFQEVRERLGLCYSIYSTYWALADSGLFAIHAATGPDMMAKLVEVVAGELRRAAAAAPTAAEMARAKAQIKAGMLMGLESSSARAEYMARQLLLFDKLIDTSEIIARIEAVTPESVQILAARLLTASKPSITVVGAGRKGAQYSHLAERMLLDSAGRSN
ncbi:MAG TPA: pitrilysin family protein [Hyphomicrobiaceae bacterium]|nr:pitrilysin family protein [Hyphomicrobiaceae bacterium]